MQLPRRDPQSEPEPSGSRPINQQPTRVLLVDDDEKDYLLFRDMLARSERGQFTLDWARSYGEGLVALRRCDYDAYLVDYRLGPRTGLQLLCEPAAQECRAPLILLTGQHQPEVDLSAMQAGAADYLLKDQLDPDRLERTIRYAVRNYRLLQELRDALAHIKTLQGILPICSHCKRIRDDADYWHQLESYISQRSDVRFSHGICPTCFEEIWKPQLEKLDSDRPQKKPPP